MSGLIFCGEWSVGKDNWTAMLFVVNGFGDGIFFGVLMLVNVD